MSKDVFDKNAIVTKAETQEAYFGNEEFDDEDIVENIEGEPL